MSAFARARAGVVCAALVAAGCGGAPVPSASRLTAIEGYALTFPAAVASRKGREGPVVFRIDSARTPDGARFEAAWFGFPEPLAPPELALLLARVERGLSSDQGASVTSRSISGSEDRKAVDLILELRNGRRGFHHVLYPSPSAMLQVSAVGPKEGAWEREVPSFFASLALAD